jgi:opacity protein-like surface antigen
MKRVSFIAALILAVGTAQARAQSSVATGPYAEFTTGGAGSSALFGGEGGLRLNTWDVFFEAGRMLNTKTAEMDAAAALIAQALPTGGQGATFQTKQPVSYFDVAVRYKWPTTGRIQPYAAVGVGGAKVSRQVTFAVNGTDITAQLQNAYGVLLGGDLSGSEGAGLFTFGGGAQIDLRGRWFVDASYRYARVFLSDGGLNTNRVQVGFGARF